MRFWNREPLSIRDCVQEAGRDDVGNQLSNEKAEHDMLQRRHQCRFLSAPFIAWLKVRPFGPTTHQTSQWRQPTSHHMHYHPGPSFGFFSDLSPVAWSLTLTSCHISIVVAPSCSRRPFAPAAEAGGQRLSSGLLRCRNDHQHLSLRGDCFCATTRRDGCSRNPDK